MSQSESDIGRSYSFKSIKSILDCLEKDTATLRVETDKIKVDTDKIKVNYSILKEELLYPLLIRELLEQSIIQVLKDQGYLEEDFDQNQFDGAFNKLKEEFDFNKEEVVKKLETYSLNETKYLFSIDMSYFNITKRLDLKETNRNQNLNDAINSQKQDTKLILKSLYINLKLN